MAMTPEQRRVLDLALPMLRQDLDVYRCLPVLIAENLLSDDDIDVLVAEPVRSLRVIKFIRILQQRGSRAYDVFLNILRQLEGASHLADHITELHESLILEANPLPPPRTVNITVSGYDAHNDGDVMLTIFIIVL
ncbi:hypothetical protein HOLleu_20950 [Holothuria leucospilota]|uniref:CARD domain-containing protein n=1 Tax=Holothuria leucospilota TaxID=206669 RepID=A0A9Q1BX38_HOLLE|nr:hypothetical protein HOLleu_20950 [Holothuria leucospilota]